MTQSGQGVSYAELDARSNQGAQLFRSMGLSPGDAIALYVENCPDFFEIAWAAQRSGLYYVCLSTKLQADEIAHILTDSDAKLLLASANLSGTLAAVDLDIPYMIIGNAGEHRSFLEERSAMPATAIVDEQAGFDMLYSSGTTGRPKGIRPREIMGEPITTPDPTTDIARDMFGAGPGSVYLCPAPLYHAAPLKWCMAMLRLGATVVVMEKFDDAAALAAIARWRVTIAQFVPTHFVRMLKLPPTERHAHDLSSLQTVLHAAAPCPVPVKEAMIDWLGPIVHEYYSGSEGIGGTFIGPHEWLEHKGSVGRPRMGMIHICDDDDNELPPRTEGNVYFSGGRPFAYHNDPEKTRGALNRHGWATLGDVGWVDEDGYLYLTDRKSFMIISGGVNIYPQEVENLLVTHPDVADVAVIGAPDAEMGEKVVAVIEAAPHADPGDALAAALTAFARERLSHIKVPRQIDFVDELPRHATGKLYKRLIRDRYWAQPDRPAGKGNA